MTKFEAGKKTGVVLNLSNNSEKETILKAIIASGEFEIHDTEGVVTLYFKKAVPQKQHVKLSRIAALRTRRFLKLGSTKQKKHVGILERVAKSQDITLATSDSLNAVCSGVIV